MTENLRTFWSAEIEQQFMAALQDLMLGWPSPYQDLYVPTRFGDTHIVANGSPEAFPVLLLNPGGGSSAIWIHNIGPLSQYYRTYAVDVIGEMNKSISKKPMENEGDFFDWMQDLLDGLGVLKVHVIGNSNGGFLSLLTALHFPNRVEKVVLISPAATFVQMWAFWIHLMIPAHMIAPLIHSERLVLSSYAWLWQSFPKDTSYEHLYTISKIGGYPRYRPSRNKVHPRVFTDEELLRVKNPVLMLIGDHEVIYDPLKAIARASRLLSDFRAVSVPAANHSAQYTAPEFVNEKIIEFLSPPIGSSSNGETKD
jgi:pimeloyl-ACP methyl ester carboxylesterase